LPTAFWHPAVHTDSAGHAELSFVAPDQLTAFRMMAVAADVGDRFGSAESRFRVAKPFALHPVLPRFLMTGDVASVGAALQNDTAKDGRVTVIATATGVKLEGESRRTVSVPRGARVPVTFEVKAEEAGSARFSFRAELGSEKDAALVTLPVERPSPIE